MGFVLETSVFPERHTGIAKLNEITDNFMIKDKVTAVVHDQAANMELSLFILNDEEVGVVCIVLLTV